MLPVMPHDPRESLARTVALRRQLLACPGDDAARRELLRLYLGQGRPREAALVGEPLVDAPQIEGRDELRIQVAWAWAAAGEPARSLALLAGHPMEAHLLGELGRRAAGEGCWDAAAALFGRAHALDPGNFEGLHALAHSLDHLHRFEASEALRRQGLARGPDPGAQALLGFGIAQGLLLQGRWEEGWAAMAARFQLPGTPALLAAPGRPWAGEDPRGRTVLVQWEQGFGDAFMALRGVSRLAAAGAQVVLGCPEAVVRILGTCAGLRVLQKGDRLDLPADTLQVPMLDLPWRTGGPTWEGPYLGVPDEVPEAERLRAALEALPPGRRIGLCWEGSPAHVRDGERSLPGPLLARLAPVPGVQWIQLTRAPRSRPDLPMLGLGDLDFAQVAFVLARLDGLVSVDSAYAHLAGAMGIPVHLLLHHLPDWRWGLGRPDTPWYLHHRLWRQPSPGDWGAVLGALAEALEA